MLLDEDGEEVRIRLGVRIGIRIRDYRWGLGLGLGIQKAMTPSSSEGKNNPFNWVLLDEDGEEVAIFLTGPYFRFISGILLS